jgi:hypothetical protein
MLDGCSCSIAIGMADSFPPFVALSVLVLGTDNSDGLVWLLLVAFGACHHYTSGVSWV